MRPYSQLTLLQRYHLWALCKTDRSQKKDGKGVRSKFIYHDYEDEQGNNIGEIFFEAEEWVLRPVDER